VSNDLVVSELQGRALAPLDRLAQQTRGFIEAAKAENTRRGLVNSNPRN
jgi:hypothetical protein